MTPPIPMRMIYPRDNKELIEQIRAQDARLKDFAGAVGDVAYDVLMASAGTPNVTVAERLRDSIIELMCCGTEKQIAMLETQHNSPHGFLLPKTTVEMLAYLCKERDQLQGQIDQVDNAKAAFEHSLGEKGRGFMAPMSEMMEATIGTNLRQRLADLEERISMMQREMESSEPPTETDASAESAGGKEEKKLEDPTAGGQILAESVTCKLCKAVITLPTQPPIIGDKDPVTTKFAIGFYDGIMKHIGKEHPEMRMGSVFWTGMFAEMLILSIVDCAHAQDMQAQYDVKRLQILRLAQRKRPQVLDSGEQEICDLFEETDLAKSLEEKGFKLATGFLADTGPLIKT